MFCIILILCFFVLNLVSYIIVRLDSYSEQYSVMTWECEHSHRVFRCVPSHGSNSDNFRENVIYVICCAEQIRQFFPITLQPTLSLIRIFSEVC
jgi:hypothetical protein